MVQVALRGRFGSVQEPLVAHVAFAAAEENIGTLLLLHTLVTAEDTGVEIRNNPLHVLQKDIGAILNMHSLQEKGGGGGTSTHCFPFPCCCRAHETKHL